jgi:hypothetical protein
MSTHGASEHDPHGHQSEDHIAFGKVIWVGVISLFLFALGTVWAAAILHRETKRAEEATGQTRQAVLGRAEIGIVDQVPFNGDHRLADWRKERATRLNGYGWIDRARGVAHVPIERAMEAAAGGALPAGAPR